jgi:DNA primase catalytic core
MNEWNELKMKERLIIPIHDERGRLVAFSGRRISDDPEKKYPKYYNSPENPYFEKNSILFNFHRCQKNSFEKALLVCEGYMDVIGAYKLGIKNAVAVMGVNISLKQKSLLKQNHNDLILCFDGDQAGRNGMLREIPELLRLGFRVNVLDVRKLEGKLAESPKSPLKDLMDYAQAGITQSALINAIQPAIDYLIEEKYLSSFTADSHLVSEKIAATYEEAKRDECFNLPGFEKRFNHLLAQKSGWSKEDIDQICQNEMKFNASKDLNAEDVKKWVQGQLQLGNWKEMQLLVSQMEKIQMESQLEKIEELGISFN